MPARVQFTGFDDLYGKLSTIKDEKEMVKQLRAGVRRALSEVVKDAKRRIPIGSAAHKSYKGKILAPGYAQRSIRLLVKKDFTGHKITGLVGVRAEAFYALQFVELGTSKMAAQPWLRPAFLAAKDPSVRLIGEGMREWIEQTARKNFARGVNPNTRSRGGRDLALGAARLAGLEST